MINPIILLQGYLAEHGITAEVEMKMPGISVLRCNNHYCIMYVARRQTFKNNNVDIANIADPDCFEKVLEHCVKLFVAKEASYNGSD